MDNYGNSVKLTVDRVEGLKEKGWRERERERERSTERCSMAKEIKAYVTNVGRKWDDESDGSLVLLL